MAYIFSVAGKSAGGAATGGVALPVRLAVVLPYETLAKARKFRDFLRFSKFCPIKENSEGILMMLWVVVSSEVVHLLLWFDNPWLRTHRLREKQILYQKLLLHPLYIYIYIYIYMRYSRYIYI